MPKNHVSLYSPLKVPVFRSLWLASLGSNFGTLVQAVAAAWLMTTLTDSRQLIALVQASTTLPLMFFSIPSGALADKFNRRKVMLFAQFVMLVAAFLLMVFGFLGWLSPWSLLLFTFLNGCGAALHYPSWQAATGDIVSRRDLPSAVSLNSMGFNLMRTAAPAAGGMIVAVYGAVVAFTLNFISYFGLIFVLYKWKHPARHDNPNEDSLIGTIATGIQFVAASTDLARIVVCGFCFGISAAALPSLMPVIVTEKLHGDASIYGLVLSAFGAGAILGAATAPRLRYVFGTARIIRAAFLIIGVSMLVISLGETLWLTFAFMLAAGAFWVIALSQLNVTIQLSSPRFVVGRTLSIYQAFTFGSMAIGSYIWGTFAEIAGVTQAIFSAGILVGLIALLRIPNINDDDSDQGPLNR